MFQGESVVTEDSLFVNPDNQTSVRNALKVSHSPHDLTMSASTQFHTIQPETERSNNILQSTRKISN